MRTSLIAIAAAGLLAGATADAEVAAWTPSGPAQSTADGFVLKPGGALVAPGRRQDVRVRFHLRCTPDCPRGLVLSGPEPGTAGEGYWLPLSGPDAGEAYRADIDARGLPSNLRPLALAPNPLAVRVGMKLPDPPRASIAPIPIAADRDLLVDLVLKDGVLTGRLGGRAIAGGNGFQAADPPLFGRVAVVGPQAGEVRISGPQVDDLLNVPALTPERTDPGFEMHKLSDLFFSEGVAVGDVNRDGHKDIVAGPNIYLGPDFKRVLRFYPARATAPNMFTESMLEYVVDVDGDGWPDILQVGLPGRPAVVYRNPGASSRSWERHVVVPVVSSEATQLADLFGDGRKELVMTRPAAGGAELGYAEPDPDHPFDTWRFHAVSAPGAWGAHGLGVGDVNGDGRRDILHAKGWFEQPKDRDAPWIFHPQDFGSGADMYAVDVDGDGLKDVVTTLNAHGYGLAWFKQIRKAGQIGFEKRIVLSEDGHEPHAVSELHALGMADFNGDGLPDLIVGKRWWAHLDTEFDPDANGPALLYRFSLKRKPQVAFIPTLLNSNSGAGVQLVAEDVDGDGRPDVVVSTRKGTFLFLNRLPRAH